MTLSPKARYHVTILCVAFFTLTTAWAAFNIWSSEYTLTKKELQQSVNKQFPKAIGDKKTIQVTLGTPALTLDDKANRISAVVDTKVHTQLLPQDANGKVTVSSGIKYDESVHAIILDHPQIEHIAFAEASEEINQQLSFISSALVQQLLNDYPVYTFQPEQFVVGDTAYRPKDITIEKDSIKIQMASTKAQ